MGETEKRPGGRPGARRSTSSVLTPPTGIPSLDDLGLSLPAQRASEQIAPEQSGSAPTTPPPVAPRTPVSTRTCTCGHEPDAHEHYRPGADCAFCGREACARYRPRGGAASRLMRKFGRRA
ncbi:hypothetical protein [Pseudonocardia sp. T1-2H]|uniref:hypothetical protein n=1 Tax=Pseudonocardia sp. T1-2H TaxID=3128899 RepID=UPI003100B34A